MTRINICGYCGVSHGVYGEVVCDVSLNKEGLPILKNETEKWFAMEIVTRTNQAVLINKKARARRLRLLDIANKRVARAKNKNGKKSK